MATRLGERDARLQQLTRPPHRMSWLSTARLPRPHDPERRDVAWTRWNEKSARPGDPDEVALLDALFGNSPYLTETALQNPGFYDLSRAPRARCHRRGPRDRARGRARGRARRRAACLRGDEPAPAQ